MTGAEFRAASESLGLSTIWLARRFQVADRTVRAWAQGTRAVPASVSEVVAGLRDVADSMADAMLDDIVGCGLTVATFSGTDQLDPDWRTDNPIGLPDSFHRIACEIARLEAAEDGQIVTIVYQT